VSIKTTDATGTATDFYYYFYDWEVQGAGCTSTPRKSVTGTVNVCTGTGAVTDAGTLNVFPNPAASSLDISFESASGNEVKIELINSIGGVVYASASEASGTIRREADITALPAGIYLLRITDGEKIMLKKIVKE
jgi:hypothetical protein